MKILLHTPHIPAPPTNGGEHRTWQLIQGFLSRGDEVFVSTSTLHADCLPTSSQFALLKSAGCSGTACYDSQWNRLWIHLTRSLRTRAGAYRPFEDAMPVTRSMARWFAALERRVAPDAIVTTYSWLGGLFKYRERTTRTACDMQGLFSINNALEAWLKNQLSLARRSEPTDGRLFDPEAADELIGEVTDSEWARLAAFDHVITISTKEHEILRQRFPESRLVHVPLTCPGEDISQNTYAGSPVAVIGPNAFNLHGAELYRRSILPLVHHRLPSFTLDLGGSGAQGIDPATGIRLIGKIPSMKAAYGKAAFAVCLAPFGTGQQFKIVEAMAHGLPVIAWQSAARGTLIADGVTGFAPRTAEDWCDRILQLAGDPELCREMGRKAHAAATAEYSAYRTLPGLLV